MVKIVRMGEGEARKVTEIFPSPTQLGSCRGWNCIVKQADKTRRVLLWMQFTDLDEMESFGQELVNYAKGNR